VATVVRRAALALEVVWGLLVLGLGSDAGLTFPALLLLLYGALALLVLWLVRFVLHAVATRRTPLERRYAAWLLEPACVLLTALAVWSGERSGSGSSPADRRSIGTWRVFTLGICTRL